jgi:hypothetical protein
MPLSSILILTGIVAAFATFGTVLAWAERRTRNIHRERLGAAASAAPPDDLKMAA